MKERINENKNISKRYSRVRSTVWAGSQTRARLGLLKFWREIQTRPLRGLLAFQEHKDNRSLFDGMALLWRWKVIVYLSIAIG